MQISVKICSEPSLVRPIYVHSAAILYQNFTSHPVRHKTTCHHFTIAEQSKLCPNLATAGVRFSADDPQLITYSGIVVNNTPFRPPRFVRKRESMHSDEGSCIIISKVVKSETARRRMPSVMAIGFRIYHYAKTYIRSLINPSGVQRKGFSTRTESERPVTSPCLTVNKSIK